MFERDDVERAHDVRMPNARGEARLVDEHRRKIRILRELRMQSFDGDGARESDGAEEASEMDRRHAAGGDFVMHGIPPDEKRPRALRLFYANAHGSPRIRAPRTCLMIK